MMISYSYRTGMLATNHVQSTSFVTDMGKYLSCHRWVAELKSIGHRVRLTCLGSIGASTELNSTQVYMFPVLVRATWLVASS